MSSIRIATRGSKLALWQAHFVADKLKAAGHHCELNIIKTQGDKILNKPLYDIGGKSLFIKELEQALLAGEADLAVHSLKDLPAKLESGFELAAVMKRHEPFDVMIFKDELFKSLHQTSGNTFADKNWGFLGGKTIGTSSLRREHILKTLVPTANVKSLRGNIDTRLQKLAETSEFDAIILAEASLERLDLKKSYKFLRLDHHVFVPCAGQGAVAIECLHEHSLAPEARKLNCARTSEAVHFERSIVGALGADCKTPIGCLAVSNDDGWEVFVKIISKAGEVIYVHRESSHLDKALRSEIFAELNQHKFQNILLDLGLRVPPI